MERVQRFLCLVLIVSMCGNFFIVSKSTSVAVEHRKGQFFRGPQSSVSPFVNDQTDDRYAESMTEKRADEVPSPLLTHVLVIICFHWNVGKLLCLERILDVVHSYRTRVDVVVVTDRAQALQTLLKTWGASATRVHVWQAPSFKSEANTSAFSKLGGSPSKSLMWAHRQAIEARVREIEQSYSTVVYLEDDMRLEWPALVSWALDTEVLEPLNLTRCFYRTEVEPEHGKIMMLDWTHPLQLSKVNMLALERINEPALVVSQADDRAFSALDTSDAYQFHQIPTVPGNASSFSHHWLFVYPEFPYQGLWVASRAQLSVFMAHPYWNEVDALTADLPAFGYMERSNVMNLFINVPTVPSALGRSNCVIPAAQELSQKSSGIAEAAPRSLALAPLAAVGHMTNKYSQMNSKFAKVPVERALGFE